LVFRSGCTYRERLEELLAARGIKALRRLELGTLDGLIGCAAAGLGITLLPRSVVESARRSGLVAVHRLPPSQSRVTTVFIRRKNGFTSQALSKLLRCAHRAWKPKA
jgi:DNA-binding transcriptional LysR family regulator